MTFYSTIITTKKNCKLQELIHSKQQNISTSEQCKHTVELYTSVRPKKTGEHLWKNVRNKYANMKCKQELRL